MHEQLAKEFKLASYRKLPTLSVSTGSKRSTSSAPSWLDGQVARVSEMDPASAQVTPKDITNAFMDAALANGATLKIGTVQGLKKQEGEGLTQITAVVVDGEEITADKVVSFFCLVRM